jgi:hypothetical protein
MYAVKDLKTGHKRAKKVFYYGKKCNIESYCNVDSHLAALYASAKMSLLATIHAICHLVYSMYTHASSSQKV